MTEQKKTHRVVKNPQISARFLADYMAASDQARRTIVRNCRYQGIGRVVQHDEAKASISKFLRDGKGDVSKLTAQAQAIRGRMADSDFDRDVMDHNADYIDRFAAMFEKLNLPKADILAPGPTLAMGLFGVKVTMEMQARLRRIDKNNKARTGGLMLRYLKGKPVSEDVAAWQSALLLGFMNDAELSDESIPEGKLCITLDAHAGVCHAAPSDAVRRYRNMGAACATIAEVWNNIPPPHDAIF